MKIENWSQYQAAAASTARYPAHARKLYPALGLLEECGELAGKLAKQLRDGTDNRDAMILELGDVCWMLSALASEHGVKLEGLEMPSLNRGMPMQTLLAENIADLMSSAGELSESVIRASSWTPGHIEGVAGLCFDVARSLDVPLSEVLERNIAKLADRQARGVIQGAGDHR
jgi:NTP pyrophosphatase (non-canonical NTP hydrolase)